LQWDGGGHFAAHRHHSAHQHLDGRYQQTIWRFVVQSTLNGTNQPALFYVGTPPTNSIVKATLVITNDNSYGTLQFSAPSYLVNEKGSNATSPLSAREGRRGRSPSITPPATAPMLSAALITFGTTNVLMFATNQIAAQL